MGQVAQGYILLIANYDRPDERKECELFSQRGKVLVRIRLGKRKESYVAICYVGLGPFNYYNC